MFARRVFLQLKPKSAAELTERTEKEIIPILRKQKGFVDQMTLVNGEGTKSFAISLWENAESAEVYNRGAFAEVQKILSKFVDGTPKVETYNVLNSTFHKIAATVAA
jgi:hypothetical protein